MIFYSTEVEASCKSYETTHGNVFLRTTTSPLIASMLFDFYQEDECCSKYDIMNKVYNYLQDFPADVFVLVAILNDEIVGTLIAWTLEHQSYVWLDQASVKSFLDHRIIDIGFQMLTDWTKKKGYNMIRMMSKRNSKVFERVYGFHTVSKIMQKEI